MSKLVLYMLLHSEILKLLEKEGYYNISISVERYGINHEIYDFLDKLFSMYYSDYGGLNCKILEQKIKEEYNKVVNKLLPNFIKQYIRYYQEKERKLKLKERLSASGIVSYEIS